MDGTDTEMKKGVKLNGTREGAIVIIGIIELVQNTALEHLWKHFHHFQNVVIMS